jgi:TIR domain-containing protein
MTQQQFPKKPEVIIKTLADLCGHQNMPELVSILNSSKPRIEQVEYDNWNGGTYYYLLELQIPLQLFAQIEPRITKIETQLKAKVDTLLRTLNNHSISDLKITPLIDEVASPPSFGSASEMDLRRIWEPGMVCLFLSHVSAHKVFASSLKSSLRTFGISAFVAHEDIQPSIEWMGEIELALNSMHALAALLTANFKDSLWTDQEVGFALGKGIFVIPVKLERDPHGFIGKQQGLPAALDKPSLLASSIVDVLLRREELAPFMRESLVWALENSNTFANSKSIAKKIESSSGYTHDQLDRLEKACEQNSQVRQSFGVPDQIKALIKVHRPEHPQEEDIPF